VQYLEQSVANWVMSGEVLAFMIPELSLASPHFPRRCASSTTSTRSTACCCRAAPTCRPKSYGETPINPMWAGDEIRDAYEIELFHEFVTQGKPVFGICRGHQVINVALGGSLYQDIATQCPDKGSHRDEASTTSTSTSCASCRERGCRASSRRCRWRASTPSTTRR
jgi:putative glutamine amidotransferase